MTLSQSFKKIICDSSLSVSHILQALNELTQLVYLQNVDAPVIAFLPERYQVFQKNQHFFFQRTRDFCYIRDHEEIDISSNIQPSSEQKEASSTIKLPMKPLAPVIKIFFINRFF